MFTMTLQNNHQKILFIVAKASCSITLLFYIFLLIRLCIVKTTQTLIYQIKTELIISSIIYSVGILIPMTDVIDDKSSTISIIGCHLQAILSGFSNFTSILLYTSLPYITTQVLIEPSVVEKNQKLTRFKIAFFTWIIPLIESIVLEVFGEANYDEYACWYLNEIVGFFYSGINVLVFITLNVLLFRLKRKIKRFVLENKGKMSEVNYLKGFLILMFSLFSFY